MEIFGRRNVDYEVFKFLKGSIIVIEGNISSGKSTLSRNMERYLNSIGIETKLFEEPILESYLNIFLQNMEKYAFGFQVSMLIERQCLYQKALDFIKGGGVAIIDRSFFGDKVFAILHHEEGNIDDEEFAAYEDIFSRLQFDPPSFILYLEVEPEVNVERCNRRLRLCEKEAYSLEYFQNLNRLYEEIIPEMTSENGVLRFNWSKDIKSTEYNKAMLFVLEEMRNSYLGL